MNPPYLMTNSIFGADSVTEIKLSPPPSPLTAARQIDSPAVDSTSSLKDANLTVSRGLAGWFKVGFSCSKAVREPGLRWPTHRWSTLLLLPWLYITALQAIHPATLQTITGHVTTAHQLRTAQDPYSTPTDEHRVSTTSASIFATDCNCPCPCCGESPEHYCSHQTTRYASNNSDPSKLLATKHIPTHFTPRCSPAFCSPAPPGRRWTWLFHLLARRLFVDWFFQVQVVLLWLLTQICDNWMEIVNLSSDKWGFMEVHK